MFNHIISAILTASLGVPAAPGALDLEELPSTVTSAVQMADVASSVDLTDGLSLELSYELAGVGEVLLAVHADAEGEGKSLVWVDGALRFEFELRGGEATPLYVDESFAPEQAEIVAASVAQVWSHELVHRAFAAAATGDERDLKCTIAGSIAGVATGGLLIAGCFLITKRPKCGKLAAVGVNAGCYIADKCNGAQN